MFANLITIENLFNAWYEFRKGKSGKKDVWQFECNLEDNLFQLHEELITKTYFHQPYHTFYIWDPKFRIISKASVRDRVVHHLLYKYLEKIFQPIFIYHSYSCQVGKGIHKAVDNLDNVLWQATKNYTKNIWYLKLDIKKFFASLDHEVLLRQLYYRVYNLDMRWLLNEVVNSYSTPGQPSKGVPIGNLTSQIFANIYLNELDYFVKSNLREKYYFRYADDFVFLKADRGHLEKLKKCVFRFVEEKLHLTIHPDKIVLQKFSEGLDFLGYVLFPHYRVLRTKTKKRMLKKTNKKVEEYNNELITDFDLGQTMQSYLGVLKHCNGYDLGAKLKNNIWFNKKSKQFFDVDF